MREDSFTAASPGLSKLELQLGEMIGTVKMTVGAIETLRQTVERLTERAAFKNDLDAVQVDIQRRLDKTDDDVRENKVKLSEEIKSLSDKISGLQRWMWICIGAATVLGILLRNADLISKVFGGN